MRTMIEKFFESGAFAVAGVSENEKKFGSMVFKEMKSREFDVLPLNPKYKELYGQPCFNKIADLPEKVKSLVIVTPPAQSENLVREAAGKGLQAVWLQQGAESEQAIQTAKENNLAVVHGQCILMFLEPVKSFHALHRWINKLLKKYPQ